MTHGILKKLACCALILLGFGLSAAADESKIPEPFRGETKGSPISITYDDWSRILKITVFDAGMSDRDLASAPRPEIGTRITRGNTSTTRNEGNRIMFPAFVDYPDNLAVISEIRQDLERVPNEVPMREWSEKEQLAYWLNLYNITLVELISREYPMTNLKSLMKGSRKNPALWDRKVLKVSGIDLSLNDIHDILVNKWDSTLVMYGLWQGYVGGPNIRTEAYTADKVHSMLVENAREFVNSNRGMRLNGNTLQISELYAANKALFPNWEEDLKKHFVSLTDPGLHARIKASRKIKATTSDYYIADLMGGTRGTSSGANTNSAGLVFAQIHGNAGGADVGGGAEASMGIANFDMERYADFRRAKINDMRFPDHVVKYINEIQKRKSQKEGTVEVEEIDNPAPGASNPN